MTVCYIYLIVLSALISAKANGRFKIPNREVMTDWVKSSGHFLKTCVEGQVGDFKAEWSNSMQQLPDPKLVSKP